MPSTEYVGSFLDQQRTLAITFPSVGATAGAPPPGYVIDHTRVLLGSGERVFQAAKVGLESWQQFDLGWVEAKPSLQLAAACYLNSANTDWLLALACDRAAMPDCARI